MIQTELLQQRLVKWQDVFRLRDWDIRLKMVTIEWRKTGDLKIDTDDKKAVLMINALTPNKKILKR